MKLPPLPANMPAAQKANVLKAFAQIAKASIALNLKKDKTYTAKASGVPAAEKDKGDKGTWSQVGNKVTLKSTKPGDQPKTFILSGNKMVFTMPGGRGQVVFTR